MPILGIMASQISGHLATPNNYESIATTTLSTNTSTITFSSIPATYTHLQLRGIARLSSTSNYGEITFNSDAAANYTFHKLNGNGSSASAYGASGTNSIYLDYLAYNSTTASAFGVFVVDILDYLNTNKYKTVRYLGGNDGNGNGGINLASGVWRSTSAISTLTIKGYNNGTDPFVTYSSFALYGVK